MPRSRPISRPIRFFLLCLASSCLISCAGSPAAAPTQSAEIPPGSLWLEVDGASLHYSHGLPGGLARARVLLIHGFGASTDCWRFLAPALLEAGYEVVEVDWPPFGWSMAPRRGTDPDYSLIGRPEATARLLWSFLDAIPGSGPGPWIVVGHSMGGRIGAWMASQRPASTRALVLIAPATLGTIGAPALGASPLFRSALKRNLGRYLSDPAFVASSLARAYGRKPRPEETRAYQAPLLRPGAQAELLSWTVTASERKEPPFAAIDCPCLILWGTRDRIVKNQGSRLAGLLPSSTYIPYPGGGHVLMETEEGKVSADVLAFLAAQGEPKAGP